MGNFKKIDGMKLGDCYADNIKRYNTVKNKKKYRYEFTAYNPNDSKMSRTSVFADNLEEAKPKMKKLMKDMLEGRY